ncbi:MAG: ATP-binding protein [Bacilli bacterium]|nr:ATP-binding protein [Bacilli bacterium]
MFIGRKNEIELINNSLSKKGTAFVIYGKRRVGKTTLIDYVLSQKKNYIYFECLKDTLLENIEMFKKVCIAKGINIPEYVNFNNFIDVFSYINSLNERFYIVIDEYPYLKEINDSKLIDSHFQTIIDNYISNVNLFISGSQIKMMESVLKEGNPLFGRFHHVLLLKELDYIEARDFYPYYSYSDSAFTRAIFGGSPFVNQAINPNLSIEQNIINTLLNENSIIYQYADQILLMDVSGELQARRILSYLANSKRKYKEIVDKLDPKNTGIINRALESLVDLDLVRKVLPINKKNDKKKGYYEIKDNVLRFYYTYVYQNKSIINDIGAVNYYNNYIKDTIVTFVSLRFEDQVKEYFSLLSKNNKRNDILEIGTYYYDDRKNQTNGQFDVTLNTKKGYQIYEVKFYQKPLDVSLINKEVNKIKKINEIDIKHIGFININGFEKNNLPYEQISGEDLYTL